jgi:hypothetical protein
MYGDIALDDWLCKTFEFDVLFFSYSRATEVLGWFSKGKVNYNYAIP